MTQRAAQMMSRLFWTAVLTLHGFAAVMWWWMMPGGFPIGHARFWANAVAPAGVVVLVIAALAARALVRRWPFAGLALAVPAAWLGVAVGALAIFPISGRLIAAVGLVGGGVTAAAWTAWSRRDLTARHAAPVAFASFLTGAVLPLTQRGPLPATRPVAHVDLTTAAVPAPADSSLPRVVRFNPALALDTTDGRVTLTPGPRVMMGVQPLLTFDSRSPDRCWTIFTPPALRRGPGRRLIGASRDPEGVSLRFADDGTTTLRATPLEDRGSVRIDAATYLPAPVYSHLNSYVEIGIAGHRSLSLAFSPTGDVQYDVLPSDYPVGRPLRVAFLGRDGVFRIVEAHSGEKGPFRELGRGTMARADPLVVTVYDGSNAVCRIVLDDWVAQASTDLSPTAGWGLPQNAIEFSRFGDRPDAPVGITIGLASTSVGRGWDSVGHAAGTYRNGMRIEVPAGPADTSGGDAASTMPAR